MSKWRKAGRDAVVLAIPGLVDLAIRGLAWVGRAIADGVREAREARARKRAARDKPAPRRTWVDEDGSVMVWSNGKFRRKGP